MRDRDFGSRATEASDPLYGIRAFHLWPYGNGRWRLTSTAITGYDALLAEYPIGFNGGRSE